MWTKIREAIHQRIATIQNKDGSLVFRSEGERGANIHTGEPSSIHEYPYFFTLFDERASQKERGIHSITYTATHHLCFRSQDLNKAEIELEFFIDAVPDAINKEATLGGLLSARGGCHMDGPRAGWTHIGDRQVPLRCLVFTTKAIVRG